MKQTILSRKEGSLLSIAITRLNPPVFTHSVWLRFGRLVRENLPETINSLIQSTQRLQEDHLSEGIQVLLVCAFYQNQLGDCESALSTLQQALSLAKSAGLHDEVFWAYWGSAAICCQKGSNAEAAGHLSDLQAALNAQDEWILADFIEVLRQSVSHPEFSRRTIQDGSSNDGATDEIIQIYISWLQQWGTAYISPKPSHERWWKRSHLPEIIDKGKVKLNGSMHRTGKAHPVWESLRNLLGFPLNQNKSSFHHPKMDLNLPITMPFSPPLKPSILSSASLSKVQQPTIEEIKTKNAASGISINVQMLGTFNLTIRDIPVRLSPSRGLSILKYLLLNHRQNTPREVLMDVFWPDAEPEAARNSLNVSMYSLRRSLRSKTDINLVSYESGTYSLVPNLEIWVDMEEFDHCIQAGCNFEAQRQLTAAVAEYEIAVNLYRGDLLAENPYEEWTVLERERLRVAYLDTLDRLSRMYFSQERYAACITVCHLILNRDCCREDTHCLLMRCYCCQGQFHMALHQYQECMESLHKELAIDPAPETKRLYEKIRRREKI